MHQSQKICLHLPSNVSLTNVYPGHKTLLNIFENCLLHPNVLFRPWNLFLKIIWFRHISNQTKQRKSQQMSSFFFGQPYIPCNNRWLQKKRWKTQRCWVYTVQFYPSGTCILRLKISSQNDSTTDVFSLHFLLHFRNLQTYQTIQVTDIFIFISLPNIRDWISRYSKISFE